MIKSLSKLYIHGNFLYMRKVIYKKIKALDDILLNFGIQCFDLYLETRLRFPLLLLLFNAILKPFHYNQSGKRNRNYTYLKDNCYIAIKN